MDSIEQIIDDLARLQHGLVTFEQLEHRGVGEPAVKHQKMRGLLVPFQHGVYRCAGSPVTTETHLLAACLAAGDLAAAACRGASWVWGLGNFAPPIEIMVPYEQCPMPRDTIMHRSTDLEPGHVTRRRGIPVTTPARLMVDLGAVVSQRVLADVLDAAVVRGLVTMPEVYRMLELVARRGRRGVGKLRLVLADRPLGDLRPESVLEPLMSRLCRDFGVQRVVYQHEVRLPGGKVYRLDFAIPHVLVGLEVDGIEWHGTREAAIRDRQRRRALKAAGWELLEFTASELRRRPRALANEITTAVRAREAALELLARPA